MSAPFDNATSVASVPRQRAAALISSADEPRHIQGGTRLDRRTGACLHESFEAQVDRTPDATAIVFGAKELTYRQLNVRANRLARKLRALGVGADARVAVRAEPAPEMAIALLGVLKSGGAYVPLAPDAPPQRLRRLLEGAGVSVVLTQERLSRTSEAMGLARDAGTPVLALDAREAEQELSEESAANPRYDVRPDDVAYVIYTSGSTGVPKGVLVPHRGICNTLSWRQSRFPLGPGDRVVQTFSFTFDASLYELFGTLTTGATLVMLEPAVARDDGLLVRMLARHRAAAIGLPPARWNLLLQERELDACRPSLRYAFTGGEAMPVDLPRRVFARLNVELTNLYGPTETSLEATYWTCRPHADGDGGSIPIGTPIDGARVYLLDGALRAVSPGAVGELFIAGEGVARGYLDNPALTAERFLPDPFAPEAGTRMYRTGDLGRRRPDGAIEFLGRRDHQVKLRGYRIELGEVESVLASHPQVGEAVAIVREDRPGERQLVAYVTPCATANGADGAFPSSADLRRWLAERLPEHMLPSGVVSLDSLPRTAGGKPDRAALPAPTMLAPGRRRAEPREPLAAFLASLWEEVLGVREFDDDADFFELGGTSLHVAVLIHKLQDRLGEFVYTVALYDAPTLAALTAYVKANYPASVERLFGTDDPSDVVGDGGDAPRIDEGSLATFRGLVRPRPRRSAGSGVAPKNPTAAFVLSPPRSGSTLFRIMLGGNPRLFAPPELQLLNYDTLRERREALASERDRFWLEGTIRALMEIEGCDVDAAERLMEECERRDLSTKEFYALMQSRLGETLFVDKTPTYAFDLETLRRAEEDFDRPRYVHLIRHPCPMISSFEEAKIHVFLPPFFERPLPFSVWEQAELVWTLCHRNILAFLEEIPAERKLAVRFEELVRDPQREMRRVADFLDVPFVPEMADPYRHAERSRMTDALHPLARMLGDVKFHSHGQVRADAAERRKGRYPEGRLGEPTLSLARMLGYEIASPERPERSTSAQTADRTLVPLRREGTAAPLFCVHPAGGTVAGFRDLAAALGPDQPVYAFQSPAVEGGPVRRVTIEGLADQYLEGLRRVQPKGPYLLAGWSFGGVVAFEMALRLEAARERVALLALLDSDIPDAGLPQPRLSLRLFLAEFLQQLGLSDAALDERRESPRSERMETILAAARRAGILPPATSPVEFRRLLVRSFRLFRANVAAARRYVPAGRVERAILVRPSDRSATDAAGPMLDWADLANEIERHEAPGDHYTLLREPNVRSVVDALRSFLGKDR